MSDRKKKGGWVYGLLSTRKNGKKEVYTGGTGRAPYKRWGEHKKEVAKPNSKTWVGKGTAVKPIGAFWSNNWRKAEKTMKKKSPAAKKRAFGYAASKYKKRK